MLAWYAAAGAWVLGTDAAFVVTRAAAEVLVEVLRGQAEVGSSALLADSVTMRAPARLRLATVTRSITALKSKLQRTNPVEDQTTYNRMFARLLELESRRRTLQAAAIGEE